MGQVDARQGRGKEMTDVCVISSVLLNINGHDFTILEFTVLMLLLINVAEILRGKNK